MDDELLEAIGMWARNKAAHIEDAIDDNAEQGDLDYDWDGVEDDINAEVTALMMCSLGEALLEIGEAM